ncbi:apolipoprotein N-acyltransferase [Corynebacterium sp.]|uniref:apolipoprotein N-acyltransferase n=1 Tax=Corynebacterium sp. TaxID=1720 RepID=UPI0026DA92A9|nr:apolipoprotein N-acyltransferase [Corynebacterium sp.]MDO5031603.1 apolipoprotein N-acyltransferase [Corynebacterium sp.]
MGELIARLALAAAGGGLAFLSVEPRGWWQAGVIGTALLMAALLPAWGKPRQLSLWGGALVAFAHSLVLYLLSLPWIGELVGAMPYIALSFFLALYSLILGAGGAALLRLRWGFVAFPAFYVAVEMLRSSVPFGGFSWVRLAWGQIEGPLANLAPWGGPALITFATVCIAAGFVGLATRGIAQRAVALVLIALPLGAGLLAALGINRPEATTGQVEVAAVQGNVPRMGLDFAAQRRAVLDNHVKVTEQAAARGERPDIVIWPENASDINPFANPDARQLIDAAAAHIAAPILVGTLTHDAVGARNTMQVFNPDGTAGEHHYKKYLQPFGETMPMREFFRTFTDLVDLAGDFKPGDGPGVVAMGDYRVGVATCYEVSFDQAFRSSIKNGATILATPTNNATFGYSDMTYQQLAMSRLRAIETDRAVVVAATSGVSAIVHPDGGVSQHSEIFEPKYLSETLPLRDSVTFAVRYGSLMQWALAIIGAVCALYAVVLSRVKRSPKNRAQRSPKNTDEELKL